MKIGASTANLYPMPTEEALSRLLEAGFQVIEVFINTESEATPDFAQELRRRADEFGARIAALHSYNSASEPYLLFSDYQRRLQDGLHLYDRIFKAAAIMGAPYVVLHGDRPGGVLSVEMSIRRFELLYDYGQDIGVTLLQENVFNYRSSDLSYLCAMRQILGNKAQFVFDIKQCRRCGWNPIQVINAMGEGIRHVHISDRDAAHDCLVPGHGSIDYKKLYNDLKSVGFTGEWILELYRENFHEIAELVEGCNYLRKLLVL